MIVMELELEKERPWVWDETERDSGNLSAPKFAVGIPRDEYLLFRDANNARPGLQKT